MTLRHPEANRAIALEGREVAYLLQRARRSSIGFRVDGAGLSVRAPQAASLPAIEAALQAKAGWIVRKLAEQGAYQQRLESSRIAWAAGAVLPCLGRPLTIVLAAGPATRLADGATDRLVLALPPDAAPAQIRSAAHVWLLRQAREHFTARLDHFAPLLGVQWTRLTLSSARSRWGSARIDGSIRLNWRLMHYAPEIIDYVVAHELAHLRYMDHSPRFWSTVASVVPDYAALRRALREQPAPLWE